MARTYRLLAVGLVVVGIAQIAFGLWWIRSTGLSLDEPLPWVFIAGGSIFLVMAVVFWRDAGRHDTGA